MYLEIEGQVVAGHPLRHQKQSSEHERGVYALKEHERRHDPPQGPEDLGAPPETTAGWRRGCWMLFVVGKGRRRVGR